MMNYLFSLLIALLFLLPQSTLGYMGMVCIVAIIYILNKPRKQFHDIKVLLISGIFFSWLSNSLGETESESVLRAILLCYLFLLFPYFNQKLHISIHTPLIIMSIVVLSQMADIFGIIQLQEIKSAIYQHNDNIYGESAVGFSMTMKGRYGGIYINPNDCGRSLLILLSMYTILSKSVMWKNIREKNLTNGLAIVLSFVGVLSTGSRTALIATSILIILFLYKDIMKLSKTKRQLAFVFVGALILYVAYEVTSAESRLTETSFDINDRERMIYKLFDFFASNVWSLFFGCFYHGHLSLYGLGFEGGLDSDIGNLIYYYGILNVALLFWYIYCIARNNMKLFMFVAPVFLTMVSNGLFTGVMASFHIMILLAIFYIVSQQIKLSENN